MKIIIDGPDNSGKTTWAKKLGRTYGLEYNHLTADDPRGRAFYASKFKIDNQIWDRHFISEYVYSKILNRFTEFDERAFEIVLADARKRGVMLFIMLGENYDVTDESQEIQNHQNDIHNLFLKIAQRYEIPIIWKELNYK